MSAAAPKSIASIETAGDNKAQGVAKGVEHSKATAGSHRPQEVEARRRRWGVETAVVRSMHARKF
jgi:hypothetical protein